MKSVCVFCGSNFGVRQDFEAAAQATGRAIAEAGYDLVYGGAKVGLMGAVANAALDAGGRVIGVLPEALQQKELAHTNLSELHIVGSMHERKAMMAERSDAFIALPGGTGTLEEIFEVWTWGQLGYHRKPCGFLNVQGFYDGLLSFLDTQAAEGFVRQEMRMMAQVAATPEELLKLFDAYTPPAMAKWIAKADT